MDIAAHEALASNPTRMAQHLGWEYRGRVAIEREAATSSSTVLPLGPHPCADGYVAMMMTPQQLAEMLRVLDDEGLSAHFARPDAFVLPETKEVLDAVLYPWLLSRTRQEVTDAGQEIGWPVVGVNEPAEVLAAHHLHQRGFWRRSEDRELGPVMLPGAPYRFAEGGWDLKRSAPELDEHEPIGEVDEAVMVDHTGADPSAPPLTGIKVLDITTVWSGPLLTLHLADLGAEVIRVESPRVYPPTTRGYAPRPSQDMLLSSLLGGYGPADPERPERAYNRHAMYNSVNRGKRSCTLDVRFAEQRELFFELVAECDVFVENLKMSTLHQMGIHETELLEANPRMIVLRLPPAGLTGDWAHYTGFGGQFDGLSSFATLSGHRDTTLMETPTSQHMDTATGPAGVFAVLSALHYRAATGRGQLIEMAQSENVLSQLGDVFVGSPDRDRADEAREPRSARCSPGPVRVCRRAPGGDHRDRRLGLGPTPRGSSVAPISLPTTSWPTWTGGGRAHDQLDEVIGDWTSTISAQQAFEVLQDNGVAAAPLMDEGAFAADPQVVARDWIRPLSQADTGEYGHLGPAVSGLPLAWERGAPALGEHNEYVLRTLLGRNEAVYERLVEEGVAVEDYLDSEGRPV